MVEHLVARPRPRPRLPMEHWDYIMAMAQLVSESSRLELLFRHWHSFSTLVPLFDVRPMEADDHAIFSYSPLELFFRPCSTLVHMIACRL